MIFLSEGNRNALPVELICIVVLTARFTTLALITIAANLKPKECLTKSAPIFVIFSNSKQQAILPGQLIRIPKTSCKIYSRKAKYWIPAFAGMNDGRGV